MNRNVILVGATGSGKTSIGRKLAAYMRYGFIDTDELISSTTKKSVNSIFEEKGETFFRDMESEYIRKLRGARNFVIATGGGSLERAENQEFFGEMGCSVWLRSNLSELVQRFLKDPKLIEARPLLKDILNLKTPAEKKVQLEIRLQTLSDQRASLYKKSTLDFDTSYMSDDLAAKILRDKLKEYFQR